MDNLIAVELFAGAGGLSIGLEKAGFKVVLANEIEKDFAQTFKINHPGTHVINKDIAQVDFKSEIKALGYSDVTLLSGGPPCQGFSTVGSKIADDPRNALFFEFLRAVSELSPSYVLFENVSGFKKMYGGVAYKTLLKELSDRGYQTTSGVLEASNYGLPQRRQRTIVVGWKKGLPRVSLPQPTHFDESCVLPGKRKVSLMDAISDLPALSPGGFSEQYSTPPKNEYQSIMRGGQKTLTEHNCTEYGEKMKEILSLIPAGGSVFDLPERLRPKSYFNNTYARLLPDVPSPTITRNFGTPSSSRCVHPFQNRALSTREGARLQGFPDNYKFYGGKTSKNLQIGNAVPPVFGEVIALEIIKSIKSNTHNGLDIS